MIYSANIFYFAQIIFKFVLTRLKLFKNISLFPPSHHILTDVNHILDKIRLAPKPKYH